MLHVQYLSFCHILCRVQSPVPADFNVICCNKITIRPPTTYRRANCGSGAKYFIKMSSNMVMSHYLESPISIRYELDEFDELEQQEKQVPSTSLSTLQLPSTCKLSLALLHKNSLPLSAGLQIRNPVHAGC